MEALVSITDPDHAQRLLDLVDECVSPQTSSWHLDSSGGWTRHTHNEEGEELEDHQSRLIERQRRRFIRAI